MSESEKEEILVRSAEPTKALDLRLSVPPSWTVSQLKEEISQRHPRRPKPTEQVLIYHGRVLNEAEAPLEKILRKLENEGHHTIHLVFKETGTVTQSTSVPNLGAVPDHAVPEEAPSVGNDVTGRGHLGTSQETSERAVPGTTSPMVAVPLMMVNPIVNAAYNAALTAVYQPRSDSGPSSAADRSGSGIGTGSSNEGVQNIQQPMVPAIAFFPLGIPVLVPAAAQQQGFGVGQETQTTRPMQQPMQHRPPIQPMGGRHRSINGCEISCPGRRVMQGLQGRRGVVVYRFSLRGLIQLVLIVAVLYAYCSKEHFILGMTAFGLLYLFARPIRRLIHQHYHARDPDGRRRNRGVLHEILAVMLTLISSLFPNWNANEGEDAPFARVVREQLPEDRPHED